MSIPDVIIQSEAIKPTQLNSTIALSEWARVSKTEPIEIIEIMVIIHLQYTAALEVVGPNCLWAVGVHRYQIKNWAGRAGGANSSARACGVFALKWLIFLILQPENIFHFVTSYPESMFPGVVVRPRCKFLGCRLKVVLRASSRPCHGSEVGVVPVEQRPKIRTANQAPCRSTAVNKTLIVPVYGKRRHPSGCTWSRVESHLDTACRNRQGSSLPGADQFIA